MKKNKIISIAEAFIICAAIFCGCDKNEEEQLPSLENINTEKSVVSDNTSYIENEQNETTVTSEDMMSGIEEQIQILEAYYESDVKNITTIDGEYIVNQIDKGKIYDLDCTGECTMLVHFNIEHKEGYYSGTYDIAYTVDDNGEVVEEILNENTSGGMAQEYLSVAYYSNNGRYYLVRESSGLGQLHVVSYNSRGNSELYKYSDICSISVNGYNVTNESFDKLSNFLAQSMSEPVPTRCDGDVEVYLPDYSKVSDEEIIYTVKLVAPSMLPLETDDSKFTLKWEEQNDDDLIYNIYKIENDEYIKIAETADTFYDINKSDAEQKYCITVSVDDPHIEESDYSDIIDLGFYSYSAMDFIGVSAYDIYITAPDNFHSWWPTLSHFRFDGIPYELCCDRFVGSEDISPQFIGYDAVIDEVVVDYGDKLTDTIIVDENILETICREYNVSTCSTRVSGYEGEYSCVIVYLNLDGGLLIEVEYHLSDDDRYSFEDDYTQWEDELKEKYNLNNIPISDIEPLIEELRRCRISTAGKYKIY